MSAWAGWWIMIGLIAVACGLTAIADAMVRCWGKEEMKQ